MAPADRYSAPGGAQYDSNTMTVGDGTWDFEKNTFLLPNLQGLNFETMRYNGMANRFSTVAEYHSLIMAHAVIGALVFLLFVPVAVFFARFYTRRPGFAIKYHAMLGIFNILLLTVVFVLGWFAVGPNRSWTNPHHAIGLAIYVMFLLQAIGGRLVRHVQGRSIRVMFHQWSGRLIALLGIIQVPLGLTLYGSPKYLFILYSLWMAFLFLLYFIFDYRRGEFKDRDAYTRGGRSELTYGPDSEYRTEVTEKTERRGGMSRWLGPLAAGGALWAFTRRRNNKKDNATSRSGSRSRSRSRNRGPEVIASRRASTSYVGGGRPSTSYAGARRPSASYIDDDKYTEFDSRREDNKKGGGFMKAMLGVGAALGAGKLVSGMMNRREKKHYNDEYSAVSTETPRRDRVGRGTAPAISEYSDYTETTRHDAGTASLLPPPGNPHLAQALSAAEERPQNSRPITTRPTHARTRSGYEIEDSDYSSYVSPSRRRDGDRAAGAGGKGKGILAGLGLGWFAKKLADRKNKRQDDYRYRDEEETMVSRYTGDGYSSPSRTRRHSRRPSGRQAPYSAVGTSVTGLTEDSSQFEPRPADSGHSGPPMPPLPAGAPPIPAPYPASRSRANSQVRTDVVEPAVMPAMPADPQGVLHHESGSESYFSPGGRPHRRPSERRRVEGERAAAAAAASAGALAAEEEARHRAYTPSGPVSVKVKMHDDKDRNVTLRRLTDDEAAASRRDQRRRRDNSVSSIGTGSPSRQRYRRDSSQRRVELAAESAVTDATPLPPLSPPNPAFAKGRKPKDSAYYSGQPAGSASLAPPEASSIGSPESHGTWSAMSPSPGGPGDKPTASAADNRRRRRQERRRSESRPTGADMFD
ncbi:hypothetical protein ACHAPW_000321 [Verticillium nonalfalfae]